MNGPESDFFQKYHHLPEWQEGRDFFAGECREHILLIHFYGLIEYIA